MAKKIMVIASMLVMTATLNAQNLMERIQGDGEKSIGKVTMAKAQAWRTEEYQSVGTSNLTYRAATTTDGTPYEVVLVRPNTVYGPLQAVYKDGLSIDLTTGAAYGLGMGDPEILNSVQPMAGVSLRGDGLGWATIKTHTETVREVYGYALGATILEDVEPWELDENEPTIIYYQMIEGKYVIWFDKPEDPSYEPKTGRLMTRGVEKEVSEVKQHRPFGAELNVSATIRPYELDSAKPNTAYFSFKTTLYLKYRLFEDKWQRNRLNLYGSVGYIHGKDSEQYEGEDGPRPYTGSGITYGGGLEYRFQFPMGIKKNGKANYFWAGNALNLKVGMERNPIVRPGNTFDRWMVVSTISLSFGTSRKVAQ
ncbi:MAG: hypothetical protein IJ830_01680 [Alphaproteobacteria bacterium]|nr:hypothetical protein [Alphaproteobacteria bacterium]